MQLTATLHDRTKATLVVPTIIIEKSLAGDTEPMRSTLGQRLRRWTWVGLVAVALGVAAGSRFQTSAAPIFEPSRSDIQHVRVVHPKRAPAGEVDLPATIQAYQSTELYARANGFLKAWHAEIGAVVKAGDVLAEIDTPELDQELAQSQALLNQGKAEHQQAIAELAEAKADLVMAEANVAKAVANLDFAESQTARSAGLLPSRVVSREDHENVVRNRDSKIAELEAAKAEVSRRKTTLNTRSAIIDSKLASVRNREANVQRLRDLTGFQKVVAPFDGVVTRRNAEVGALVAAGSNTGTKSLYSMAQVDVLRVQVAVPQSSALSVRPNDPVQVNIPEKPGEPYRATITRTAGAVDPVSRSLLVEIELSNSDGRLYPGLYAQVRIQSVHQSGNLVIPTQTLLMRSDGPHVAVIDDDGKVRLQRLTLGKDSGTAVEVLVGLSGTERIIVNPADDLRVGQAVVARND